MLKKVLDRCCSSPIDSLDKTDKAIYLSVLALAARTTDHPAITGPRAPRLEVSANLAMRNKSVSYDNLEQFVESDQAELIDLSEYGATRRAPCETLVRFAHHLTGPIPPGLTNSNILSGRHFRPVMIRAQSSRTPPRKLSFSMCACLRVSLDSFVIEIC